MISKRASMVSMRAGISWRSHAPSCAKRLSVRSLLEDKGAAQSAYKQAMEVAKPEAARIPGLQEFAGSIWERRRHIPSQLYNDPLVKLFEETDLNNDGRLTADEISQALQSKRVQMTPDQVQVFIEAADADGNGTIEKNEFADLIWSMATADLNRETHAPQPLR